MVAANLALAMAKTRQRSLAIDLKQRSGDLAALFDLKPSHTLQDLCREVTRIDRVLFEQTLSKLPTGVSLLASPRSFDAALSTEAVTRVLDLGRGMFPRVVADCDPTLPDESIAALRSADAVLLVLRLEFNSLRNAKAMLDHLERQRIDPRKVFLVANRWGQPKEIPAAKVEDALGRKFFAKLPDDPKAALGSQNNGVPVLAEYPSSRLSKALTALAAALDALPAPESKGV
jgi:pilus assembly protein CpaE